MSSASALAQKGRLTERQKSKNHIASERQRREAIRDGFRLLSEIVPGMNGLHRSEALVLEATVEHMQQEIVKRDELKQRAMAVGMSEADFEHIYRVEERNVGDRIAQRVADRKDDDEKARPRKGEKGNNMNEFDSDQEDG